jgi:AsmA protein
MRASRRTIVIAACVLAGVIALGSLISFDAAAFKQRFETTASDPLGLRVNVLGRFAVKFQGDLVLVLRDVHVRNLDGAEVLSAERATIAVALLPLLFNQSYVHQIALFHPQIAIERDSAGVLNWTRRAEPRGMMPVLARSRISLAGASVHYKDETSGAKVEASALNVEVRGLRRENRRAPNLIGGLSFRAKVECQRVQTAAASITDLSIVANAGDGAVVLDPIAMRVVGGEGRATLRAELSDSIPHYRLQCSLPRFKVYECLRTLSPDTIATGTMDFAANVSASGWAPADWWRSMEGDVILSGRQIKLHGHDIDNDVSRLNPNQLLNLAGVGSFFFIGPIGIAVTRGYDFAQLIGPSGGSTQIQTIVSSWNIHDGELRAKDVAMATSKNRVALMGSLDFVHQRFDSVTVAVIDKDGCAKVKQELRGTFQKPEITKPTLLSTLLGPAHAVYKQVKDLVPGEPCTVFYKGTVAPPD